DRILWIWRSFCVARISPRIAGVATYRLSMAESGGRQRGDSECPPFSILRRALRVCSGTTAPRDRSLGRRDGRTAAPCGSVLARARKLGFVKWRKSLEMSLESVRIEFDRRTESPSSLPAQASRR